MISGEKLLIYLGVVLMLHGTYIILYDATAQSLNPLTTMGCFFSATGLIIAYVGLKGRDKVAEKLGFAMPELVEKHPLAYHAALAESNVQNQKNSSGNKAIGFILISVGTFMVTLTGLFPLSLNLLSSCCGWPDPSAIFSFLLLLLVSPLSTFGIICLSFGITFRRIAHR
ncbi:hypothetical protein Ngar_c10680 [Candidatus Nitrososphaera gargensis Ga9.2]|uniref:Uncharacterized protein n=1 Tax=Nitrososphaera gargensis (strain Ga9.2) TaxID=1237085 RepID=K0IE19_NITGG|nr:hypothetical protein [Candidatus Nitrososphaera gargensis]AFU58010.1 hypothetical protein Ngar_c10680 [Candidatus Nitrososphaera gargensis Ga9.2]